MEKKVSVIIPCYNSEKIISKLVELSINELEKTKYSYEFVLVNDFSMDMTFNEIKKLSLKYKFVKGINLAKNFGQQNAIIAGMKYADGDYVLSIDDDMQVHPKEINKILEKIDEGYDLVYGVYGKYINVKQNFFRKIGSKFNNVILGTMIKQKKGTRTSSFWIAKKFIIDEVKKYPYLYTNLRGLFFRTTSNIGNVKVEHFPREFGKSNYTFGKLISLWGTCINFSIIPLRFSIYIGFISSSLGFLYGVYLIIRKIFNASYILSGSLIMAEILFFAGIILICLGIIGEYIGRIFMSINLTPQYVVKEVLNIDSEKQE